MHFSYFNVQMGTILFPRYILLPVFIWVKNSRVFYFINYSFYQYQYLLNPSMELHIEFYVLLCIFQCVIYMLKIIDHQSGLVRLFITMKKYLIEPSKLEGFLLIHGFRLEQLTWWPGKRGWGTERLHPDPRPTHEVIQSTCTVGRSYSVPCWFYYLCMETWDWAG